MEFKRAAGRPGFQWSVREDANTDTRSRYSETRRDQEPREGRSRRGEGTEEEEEEERKTEGETRTYSVNTVTPTYILQCERSIARSLEVELSCFIFRPGACERRGRDACTEVAKCESRRCILPHDIVSFSLFYCM